VETSISIGTVWRGTVPWRYISGRRYLTLPVIGKIRITDEIRRLENGEETSVEPYKGLVVRAKKTDQKLDVTIRERIPRWRTKVGEHEIEVVPELIDCYEVRTSQMDERRWRVSTPRWLDKARVETRVRELGDALVIELKTRWASPTKLNRPSSSQVWDGALGWEWPFLLFLRERKPELIALFRCEKCGSLMADKKELRDAPVSEEIVIAHDKRRCMGCALEG